MADKVPNNAPIEAQNSNQYGIQETRELLTSTREIVTAIRISKEDDGKVTIPGDLANFLTPLLNLPKAVTGADQIPNELRDLDQLEINVLNEEFADIINDPRYRKIFNGLLLIGDGALEIITGQEAS